MDDEISSDEFEQDEPLSSNVIEKSPAVVSQHSKNALVLWEQLFKTRFRLQRVQELLNELVLSSSDQLVNFKNGDKSVVAAAEQQLSDCVALLGRIGSGTDDFNLGNYSMSANSLPADNAKSLSISQAETMLATQHKKHVEARGPVLTKWYQRSNLFVGSGTSSLTQHSGGPRHPCDLINSALADKARAIHRTQLNRWMANSKASNTALGDADHAAATRIHPEIFDDSDFYRFLLEGFLHAKTKDISNPVQLGIEFAKLNELRAVRKKCVDKRASKARKLRYDVMPKLVNFASAGLLKLSTTGTLYSSDKHRILTSCEKDALYKRLFGFKGKATVL